MANQPAPITEGDRVHWTEVGGVTFTGNVESLNLSRTHALVRLDPPDPNQVQPVEVPLAQLRRVPPGSLRAVASEVLGRTPPAAPSTEDLFDRLITAVDRVADVLENLVGSTDELLTASARARGTLEDGLAKLADELHGNTAAVKELVSEQRSARGYSS